MDLNSRELLCRSIGYIVFEKSTYGGRISREELINIIKGFPGSNPSKRRISIGRIGIRDGVSPLFGRKKQLEKLEAAWNTQSTKIVAISSWGGAGKTSLLVEWIARKAMTDWAGFDGAFDWQFNSQGFNSHHGDTARDFFHEALEVLDKNWSTHFDDSIERKAKRLAEIIATDRVLLVLDGLESFQHSVEPRRGELKDPILRTFLRKVAHSNRGLCVITSRFPLSDFAYLGEANVLPWELEKLEREDGAALLHHLGANLAGVRPIKNDDKELLDASVTVHGHAFALCLLGRYIANRYNNDIRMRDRISFTNTVGDGDDRYAREMMRWYERWFECEGVEGQRKLALLGIMGLFNRPADRGCLNELLERSHREPVGIPGLTEVLVGITKADFTSTVSSLVRYGLITKQSTFAEFEESPDWLEHRIKLFRSGSPCSDDTELSERQLNELRCERKPFLLVHPLVQEYFCQKVRNGNIEGWKTAHSRLSQRLEASVTSRSDPRLNVQVLSQAVSHCCLAEEFERGFQLFTRKIQASNSNFAARVLGELNTLQVCLDHFFTERYTKSVPLLDLNDEGRLFSQTGVCRRGLGYFNEACECFRKALNIALSTGDSLEACVRARHLGQVYLHLGDLSAAKEFGLRSVSIAKDIKSDVRSNNSAGIVELEQRFHAHSRLAEYYFAHGDFREAEVEFKEAETAFRLWDPISPFLNGYPGFLFCEFLIERKRFEEVSLRLASGLTQGMSNDFQKRPLYLALQGILPVLLLKQGRGKGVVERTHLLLLDEVVDWFEQSREFIQIPRGRLLRAWCHGQCGDLGRAKEDLDEVVRMCERSEMVLHLIDAYLCRAQLFHDKTELKIAGELIEKHSYRRRAEEYRAAVSASMDWG
jgi:tetratricopeptide (TPR) repeat protein